MKQKTQDIRGYGSSVGNFAKDGMTRERAAWVRAWVKDLMEKGEAATETQACKIISRKVEMSRQNIQYYLTVK